MATKIRNVPTVCFHGNGSTPRANIGKAFACHTEKRRLSNRKAHKVRIYLKYHSVWALVQIGTPQSLFPQQAHTPAGEGVGVSITDI